MKTKFLLLALAASVALMGQAQANGRHNGGRGTGRGAAGGRAVSSRGAYSHSSPMRSYGARMRYSRIHSSSYVHHSTAYGRHYVYPRGSTFGNVNRFSTQHYTGANHFVRSGNNSHFTQGRTGNLAHGNRLRSNWQNHVFARHSANWNRGWDRRYAHWWHGHRAVFIGGSWVLFNLGFYPWAPWPYWYPYDYYYGYPYYGGYPYDYSGYGYSYGYDPGAYDPGAYDPGTYQNGEYYYYDGQNADQDGGPQYDADSNVAAMQERLAREGYYHGQIDGIMGPETRKALADYRRDHQDQ
jgi:Putative peptidoglycan binding domain